MKYFVLLLILLLATPVQAKICDDAEGASDKASKARNEQVRKKLNQTMPAPEESRSGIASCLGSVAALADAFSMGVQTPGLDQIIAAMCNQVDSYINEKINESMGEVESGIGGSMGQNNPFQVNLNPNDLSKPLTGKLK